MTAPTIPTQRATCPHCKDPVAGLLAGCTKPACRRAEIDDIIRLDQRTEDDDA